MRLLFALLLFISSLYASKVLNYNIYDRTDRADLMLSFDTPFEGTIHQKRQNGRIIIRLSDASIESARSKTVNSPFVKKILLTPVGDELHLVATVSEDTKLQVSKTADAYGLRLRFYKNATTAKTTPQQNTQTTTLPTKPKMQISNSYYIIMALLLILLMLLFLFKKIGKKTPGSLPWLFNKKNTPKEGVEIRFQKALDPKNRIVMLDYGKQSYLVLIGNSNVLLDRYEGTQPVSQNEFEQILQNKHEELDSFMQLNGSNESSDLDSYKAKASASINFEA